MENQEKEKEEGLNKTNRPGSGGVRCEQEQNSRAQKAQETRCNGSENAIERGTTERLFEKENDSKKTRGHKGAVSRSDRCCKYYVGKKRS